MSQINFKPSNPGTREVPQYRSIVQPDGDIKLVQDGKRYLYEEIQSYEEQCDINNIVRRYMAGDVSALSNAQGVFADLTNMPKTRQEALQSIMDAQKYFVDLPEDVKAQFGNSWEQFYMAGDTKEFADAIAKVYGYSSDPVDPTPIPEETKE